MIDPRSTEGRDLEAQAKRYRFGAFEADSSTGELRKHGIRIKLNAQPFQVLFMLLDHAGELLTRDEISRELWPDGTFVDYEHGVNSAINRIRDALGDTAGNPRFVETLARRGYRFVAPVQLVAPVQQIAIEQTLLIPSLNQPPATNPGLAEEINLPAQAAASQVSLAGSVEVSSGFGPRTLLAVPEDLPKSSHMVVQTLFVLLQLMYLGFYVGALANLAEIEELLSALSNVTHALTTLIVTAAILIPVRVFLICAVLFHAPAIRLQFLKIWPFLLASDVLWALSPFLLLHHIDFGVALACTGLLVYSPFAQRSLILMGAGSAELPNPLAAP